MVTLVVEISIIGYVNRSVGLHQKSQLELMTIDNFSMLTVSHLFTFTLTFFCAAPAIIYMYARLKLLDSSTKFLRLFSLLGYSFVSYVPAVALTILPMNSLKWLFLLVACGNQLYGLYKQADQLDQIAGSNLAEVDKQQLQQVVKYMLLTNCVSYFLLLKLWFIN